MTGNGWERPGRDAKTLDFARRCNSIQINWLNFQILEVEVRIANICDVYLLRRELADEVEFLALTMFESLSAVRDFAGQDYEVAVISPEAKQVLKRFEERATHYEIVVAKRE